jgi:hypothetical protein
MLISISQDRAKRSSELSRLAQLGRGALVSVLPVPPVSVIMVGLQWVAGLIAGCFFSYGVIYGVLLHKTPQPEVKK